MRLSAAPGHGALRPSSIAGEVGYFTASIKNVTGHPGGRHHHRGRAPGGRAAARLPAGPAHGVLRHLHRGRQPNTPTCGTPWRSCSSTTPPCPSSRRPPSALGFGFRCGFLGMLHMEIIQERLEREFDLDLVTTLPSVIYEVIKTDGDRRSGGQPPQLPRPGGHCRGLREPYANVSIITPAGICGQHHAHVPGAPGRLQGHAVSGHQPGGTALLTCPSARSSTTSSTP